MDLDLKNKIVLITGSSKGIGKGIAQVFKKEDSQVILNGRNLNALKKTCNEIAVSSYFLTDVTIPEECNQLMKKIKKQYGKLDILICSVGNGKSSKPGKEKFTEWQTMFANNLLSSANMISAATPLLSKTKGCIVCISSIAGIEVTGAPLAYSSAKAGLNLYVKGIARSLAENGIRINAVAPGNILFRGSVWEKKIEKNKTLVAKLLKNEVSLGRFGTPEEIGNVVAFLSSPKSSFITGTIIVVDGGQLKS